MEAFEWLVVILSSALAVFLLVGIMLGVYLIKVAKHLNNITERAEKVADNIETASNFFKHTAGPVAISKLLANIVDAVGNAQTKKKGKK